MTSEHKAPAALADVKIHPRFKIAALWTSVMFLYIYGDIFDLYRAKKLNELLAGQTPVGPTTQGALLAFSTMMAIPSVMVFLTLALKPALSRWLNVVLGVAYTAIILVTMMGSWVFIIFLGVVEMLLTSLIVWIAWTWPRQPSA